MTIEQLREKHTEINVACNIIEIHRETKSEYVKISLYATFKSTIGSKGLEPDEYDLLIQWFINTVKY